MTDKKKDAKPTMSQTFLRACLAFLGGVIIIAIAIDLLSRYWVILVVIIGIAAAIWITIRVIRARQDRW